MSIERSFRYATHFVLINADQLAMKFLQTVLIYKGCLCHYLHNFASFAPLTLWLRGYCMIRRASSIGLAG